LRGFAAKISPTVENDRGTVNRGVNAIAHEPLNLACPALEVASKTTAILCHLTMLISYR
jgi:hypothetical protein